MPLPEGFAALPPEVQKRLEGLLAGTLNKVKPPGALDTNQIAVLVAAEQLAALYAIRAMLQTLVRLIAFGGAETGQE